MNVKNRKMIAALALTFAAGILMSRADTHYVSLDGTNDAAGGYPTWSGAATNIQWAVTAAGVNDTVLVSNGVYNLTNRISIAVNITVRSFTEQGHGTNDTIVDGGYPDRTNQCFYMTAGTLDGLTIRNGATTNTTAWQGGGGIQIAGANVNVLNCFIHGNRITNATTDSYYSGGGGIFMNSGSGGSIISNCTIVSNSVPGGTSKGGGINMWAGSLVANRVSENLAYSGGGMTVFAGTVSKLHGGQ